MKLLVPLFAPTQNSVLKAIAALTEAQLISVKHRRDKAGDATSNLYFLKGVVPQEHHPVHEENHGGSPGAPRVGPQANTKNTHLKDTHQEEKAGRDRDEAEDPPDALTHLLHFNGTYGECRFGGGLHQPGACPLEAP
jgi:hypothetical protein